MLHCRPRAIQQFLVAARPRRHLVALRQVRRSFHAKTYQTCSPTHQLQRLQVTPTLGRLFKDEHRTFTDAKAALDEASLALPDLDAPTTAVVLHTLIDNLLRKTSAVHLVPQLTDVVCRGVSSIRDLADAEEQAQWDDELCDILENLAMRLVAFPDDRCRNAALDIADLAVDLDLDAGRLFDVICGSTPEDGSSSTLSAVVAVPIAPLQIYDRAFADRELCMALLRTSARCQCKRQIFSIVSAYMRVPVQHEEDLQRVDNLYGLARNLSADDGTLPQQVIAAYIGAILEAAHMPARHAFVMAADLFDQHVARIDGSDDPLRSHLWHEIIKADPTLGAGAEHPFTLVNLWSRSKQGDKPLDAHRSFAQGPHAALAAQPATLLRFLAGLGALPSFTKQVLRAGMHMWDHCIRQHRVQPTPRIANNALRLSILGDCWGDAIDFLRSWVATSNQQQDAVSMLDRDLQISGVPLRRIEASLPGKAWSEPAKLGVDPPFPSSRLPRTLMGTAFNTFRPLSCWALWKHAPAITGHPHDHVSVLALLSGARHAMRLGDAQRRSPEPAQSPRLDSDVTALLFHQPEQQNVATLWDDMPPTLVAKRIFQHILFSQHPDARFAMDAVNACSASLGWRDLEQEVDAFAGERSEYALAGGRCEAAGALLDALGRRLPWTSVVFTNELFQSYLSLICLDRVLGGSASSSAGEPTREPPPRLSFVSSSETTPSEHGDVWLEPLRVLSWMRVLGVQPCRETMALASLAAFRDLPVWHQRGSFRDPQGHEALMGPVDEWCRGWVDADRFPVQSDMLNIWNRVVRRDIRGVHAVDVGGDERSERVTARQRRKEKTRAWLSADWRARATGRLDL